MLSAGRANTMTHFQFTFTTPELSRRLLKLGLPADSADGITINAPDGLSDVNVLLLHSDETYTQRITSICGDYTVIKEKDYLPCWSVGRLMEIFVICSKGLSELNGLIINKESFKPKSFVENIVARIENLVEIRDMNFSRL